MFKAEILINLRNAENAKGGTYMTSEKSCIFNRNSKCIFKGGICDQDCEKGNWQGGIRSNQDLLDECLGKEDRRLLFTRKVFHLFLS